jgi:hypothetical protein
VTVNYVLLGLLVLEGIVLLFVLLVLGCLAERMRTLDETLEKLQKLLQIQITVGPPSSQIDSGFYQPIFPKIPPIRRKM